jgi:protein SCO1/2
MVCTLPRALAVSAACLALGIGAARAQDHSHHHQHGAKPAAAPSGETIRIKLPDTPLVDQDGRALRFASEAVADRIVLVDFVYTTCTTICPVASALFAQVQQQLGERLGERLGKEVRLITVTVDPVRDTPPRLKEYGKRYGSGPAWTWLTGPKPQVDEVLKALDAYTPNFENHPPLVLVGDPKSGKWLRFYGFPTPEQLTGAVRDLSAARAKAG